MRHRVRGRKLGRNHSHRKAMFRNMAASLIRSVVVDEDDPQRPKVPGRITTTVPKAKELRPFVERLVTMAKKALPHEEAARQYNTDAERNSDAWRTWRKSDEWQKWNQTIAPSIAIRRRLFALLRDQQAVQILFDELAPKFEDRPGGYTRIVRIAERRLGDAGEQAFIEFVGERTRVKTTRMAPVVTEDDETTEEAVDAPADEETAAEETAAVSETEVEDSSEEATEVAEADDSAEPEAESDEEEKA